MTHRCALLFLATAAWLGAGETVRPAAVAGEFYPAESSQLRQTVDTLLAKARTGPVDGLVALISPHAGYAYSGAVAAEAYAALRGRKFTRVVVIAPTHVEPFGFTSVYDGDAYLTPLGRVPVDRAFAARLARMDPSLRLSSKGHARTAARGEHSLEVQLPFLQRVLGAFELVPVVLGDQTYDKCRALGVALAKLLKNSGDTLIVASSDLSHYHAYSDAVVLDRRVLASIAEWDYLALSKNFDAQIWEACGGGPMVAALVAAERLGATEARLLKYANSGDVTPDRTRVVGYASFALTRKQGEGKRGESLDAAARKELLLIARKSVQTAVEDHKLVRLPEPSIPILLRDRGVFVTLKQNGKLRGCVGNTSAAQPLHLAVRDVAALAAVRDPRFKPVGRDELPELRYEVSVLSPIRRIASPSQVQVGLHGVVIRKGSQEGLLLPQVAVEEKFDRKAFLENLCRKAGLPPDAWRDPDADLFVFTAEVFSDNLL